MGCIGLDTWIHVIELLATEHQGGVPASGTLSVGRLKCSEDQNKYRGEGCFAVSGGRGAPRVGRT